MGRASQLAAHRLSIWFDTVRCLVLSQPRLRAPEPPPSGLLAPSPPATEVPSVPTPRPTPPAVESTPTDTEPTGRSGRVPPTSTGRSTGASTGRARSLIDSFSLA